VALKAAGDLGNHLYHQGGWVCPAAAAALPFLVRLAADPAATVRVAIIEIVSSLARTAREVQPKNVAAAWPAALDAATPALLGLLADPAQGVHRAALYLAGVGALAGDLAIPALRERLDEESDPGIGNDVVVALGHAAAGTTWSGEIGKELALMARDAPAIQRRLAAVHALADGMNKPATAYTGLLIDAVTHPTAAGAQDSEWLGGTPGTLVTPTGRLLLADPAAAVEFATGVSERGDAQHRVAAMNHLGALLEEWRGDAAVWALIRLRDPRCIPELRSRLKSGEVCPGHVDGPVRGRHRGASPSAASDRVALTCRASSCHVLLRTGVTAAGSRSARPRGRPVIRR
jgi:hypothetical protein